MVAMVGFVTNLGVGQNQVRFPVTEPRSLSSSHGEIHQC